MADRGDRRQVGLAVGMVDGRLRGARGGKGDRARLGGGSSAMVAGGGGGREKVAPWAS